MTWLSSISGILKDYAPFSWFAVGFAFAFLAILMLLFLGKWQELRSKATINKALAQEPKTINPLADSFEKTRIKASDFFSPFGEAYRVKTFRDCEFVGPAAILFSGCAFLGQVWPFSQL